MWLARVFVHFQDLLAEGAAPFRRVPVQVGPKLLQLGAQVVPVNAPGLLPLLQDARKRSWT